MENYLEQVYLNMPEAVFYFSGEKDREEKDLQAYIGEEKLNLQSLRRSLESETEIYYYIALDISASVSKEEFSTICQGLIRFGDTLRNQDHMVLVTFGDEVNTVFDLTGEQFRSDSEAKETLSNLINSDQHTLLYEGLYQIARHSQRLSSEGAIRKAVFVISDGVDDATGKAAQNESLREIQEAGLPLYGFTVPEVAKETVNSFGEYVRATGGYLTMLEKGTEADSFRQVSQHILNCYEAVFLADNNRVSNSAVTATLEFADEGMKQSREVLQNQWIADVVAPQVTKLEQRGKRQLKAVFSEPVSGSASAENFILKSGEEELVPVYTSEGSGGDSVLLTFAEDFMPGDYELVCENLVDVSMEKNVLEGTGHIRIEQSAGTETEIRAETETEMETETETEMETETEAETETDIKTETDTEIQGEREGGAKTQAETETETECAMEPGSDQAGFLSHSGWLIALPGVLLLLLLILLSRKRKRAKEKKEAAQEVRSVYEVHRRVKLDGDKKLENKTVYIRVSGRREEMKLTIKNSMIVGRSDTCELSFDDSALSRQHFVLLVQDGTLRISNLSKSGFTAVNGVRLTEGEQPLRSGDRIQAGKLELIIRWE